MAALLLPVSAFALDPQHRHGDTRDGFSDRRGRRHERVHDRLERRHDRFHIASVTAITGGIVRLIEKLGGITATLMIGAAMTNAGSTGAGEL